MQNVDLSQPSAQLLLIGLLAVACSILVRRAMIFFRRKKAEVRPIYPTGWSSAQCRALEYFRLLVGLALIPLWSCYLAIVPTMRTNWQFAYLDVIFLIFLIFVSDAWALLLIPENWTKFGAISQSFWIMISFLVVWWGAMFTATGWMLVKASTSPPLHNISSIVYAASPVLSFEVDPVGRTT
jgi:hypothetical protein